MQGRRWATTARFLMDVSERVLFVATESLTASVGLGEALVASSQKQMMQHSAFESDVLDIVPVRRNVMRVLEKFWTHARKCVKVMVEGSDF